MSIRDQIEEVIASLPRLRHGYDQGAIPPSGLYVFFERSEPATRIVRVGTHQLSGGLPTRLRRHFGPQDRLGGNRRYSVFRLHLGGAVLYGDERLPRWLDRESGPMPEVEAAVSRLLRDRFSFALLWVEEQDKRLALERALIGALAAEPRMSAEWLGHRAASPVIQRTGLWNVQHVDATDPVDLARLAHLIERTRASQSAGWT